MPSTLPCPNPTCTHVFSPQDVRGVTSLTCPKCGSVFQFRAGAAPATPPPRKAAPPVAAPPAVPRSVPVARPVAAQPEPEVFVPPPDPRRSRRGSKPAARGKGASRRWVLVSLVLGLLLLVAAGVTGWVFREAWLGGGTPDEDAPAIQSLPMNYRFRPPRAPWAEDKGVLRELGASFAMRRSDPNAWFAVVIKDYKDRNPRDDELEREAVSRLRKLFKKGVEFEHRDEDSFAGLSAQRFVFTAENSNNVSQSGECLMTAYNGIGYWFLCWTPSAADESVLADVQQQWRDVRQGFALLKEREGWVGKQPEIVEAEGRKASYRLSYTKGLWERDDHQDEADLLLQGRDPDNPQDARKWAWVRVFVRPATGDLESAMAAARTFVEEREKRLYPEVKLDAVPEAGKGGLADGAVDLGKVKAQVLRLRVQKAEDYEHFFAVAAVPRPVYTLVIVCECAWPQRELWEQRFGPVLHTLRFDKK
jgi:hypothetical protein